MRITAQSFAKTRSSQPPLGCIWNCMYCSVILLSQNTYYNFVCTQHSCAMRDNYNISNAPTFSFTSKEVMSVASEASAAYTTEIRGSFIIW